MFELPLTQGLLDIQVTLLPLHFVCNVTARDHAMRLANVLGPAVSLHWQSIVSWVTVLVEDPWLGFPKIIPRSLYSLTLDS